jgi:hypothetical protein
MKSLKVVIGGVCACLISSAQSPVRSPASRGSSHTGRPGRNRIPGAAIRDGHSNAGRGQFRRAR